MDRKPHNCFSCDYRVMEEGSHICVYDKNSKIILSDLRFKDRYEINRLRLGRNSSCPLN